MTAALVVAYILMVIITARCVFIWVDDHSVPFIGAFVSLFIALFWPIVWLGRFISRGFDNPLKPWES